MGLDGLDEWTMFRTAVYIVGGWYGLTRSIQHNRMFGFGTAVMCWSFAVRLYGTLGLGFGDLRWLSNVGAGVFLATIVYDVLMDYVRGRL